MENGLNLTYSQYLSRRFSIQSGRNNSNFINKQEINPPPKKPTKSQHNQTFRTNANPPRC